ncbi:hypothetical protein TL16_g05724 [Triparma laevis f. inornata]|uniref:Uncharacterized protein n=1 Tax=Triparma laevis f. inornata TaxID=1714386 RepID=A0A9W7ALT3_9STRA|nr:hypothetical protein TL16_g05724 [Triparma laevis f. inornata]
MGQCDKAELLDILLTLIGDSGDFSDRIENLVAVRRPKQPRSIDKVLTADERAALGATSDCEEQLACAMGALEDFDGNRPLSAVAELLDFVRTNVSRIGAPLPLPDHDFFTDAITAAGTLYEERKPGHEWDACIQTLRAVLVDGKASFPAEFLSDFTEEMETWG